MLLNWNVAVLQDLYMESEYSFTQPTIYNILSVHCKDSNNKLIILLTKK